MNGKPPPPGKSRKPTLTPRLVAAALAESSGNIGEVAKKLGVRRSTVQALIARRPALQKALDDARAGAVDTAEEKLHAAIGKGDPWAIRFLLRTRGRDRGYSERAEATQTAPLVTIDTTNLPDEAKQALVKSLKSSVDRPT